MRRIFACTWLSILLVLPSACSTSTQIVVPTLTPTVTPSATLTSTPTRTSTPTLTPSPIPEFAQITFENIDLLKSAKAISYDVEKIAGREYDSYTLCNTENLHGDLDIESLINPKTIFQIYSSSRYYCPSDDSYFPGDVRSQFVSILDLTEGKEIFHLEQDGKGNNIDQENVIGNVALSPNGKFVFVASDSGNSYVYDIDSQTVRAAIDLNYVASAKWSPDSTRIAIARRTSSILISDLKGNIVNSFSLTIQDTPTSMTWSPDNSFIAVGDARGRVFVLTVSAIKDGIKQIANEKNTISNLTFSPDGALLAGFDSDSEGNRALNVWNVREPSKIYSLPDNEAFYWMSPQWSPDGSLLGIGFEESTEYKDGVFFLDTSSWEKKTLVYDLGNNDLRYFYFSPDQKAFFLISGKTYWPDNETWQLTHTIVTPFHALK